MFPSASELLYFSEVAKELKISKAAENLGISQPSLTLAMQRLEKTIGATLFVRYKKGVVLTKEGKILLLHAKQLVQEWENVKAQILLPKQEVHGCVTLGCNISVALYCLSDIIKDLLLHYPKLDIRLVHAISRVITEQVINSNIDVGIVVNPIKHPDLIIQKLGEDEFGFWSSNGKKNKLNDLHSNEAVIICDSHLSQTQWLLKQLKKKKINYSRIINSSSLEIVMNMTLKGCGIGVIPARVARTMNSDKLSCFEKMPKYSDEVCLVYRPENRNVLAIQKVASEIKTFFSTH